MSITAPRAFLYDGMVIRGCSSLLLICAASALAQNNVVVYPKEIPDVLVNPGMGIQTFQRFNGDALNPPGRWSEVGPERRIDPSGTPPDFPKTSLAYLRWFWWQIEPERGKYRWDIIDTALAEARRHGQKLDMRIMPYDQGNPLPEWYRNSGARRANKPEDKDGKVWSPDASDPLYIKHWGGLVAAAGARYDGHHDLDAVDVSTLGYWGEGWGPYLPDWQTQKELIDITLKAFPRTPLLMNFDQPEALRYATEHGAGWRLDCWGDMGGDWNSDPEPRRFSHMLDRYPEQLVRAGAADAWRHSPVSLETCWTPSYWFNKKWDVDYILKQALRWHVTSVNVKSSPIPPEWREKFSAFEKAMGYRFILRRFEYPKTAAPGAMMPVKMWWLNAGVAPPYQEYALALELRSPEASAVVRVPADVRKWLPGDAVAEDSVYVPASLKPGAYRIRVAMLDPVTNQPAIQLAIEGRQDDGWYDLGDLRLAPSGVTEARP